ncbi:hypothetical protein MLD38_004270 [Melastoma candidum]|uniref:Uncharacterized protein n=1 Tax=Melastoma candidum TaxID=119954 RepID=A0ACB9S907_9MYRT|nr:hypothetical protein MLD38_004270 [Melastoma candidum]
MGGKPWKVAAAALVAVVVFRELSRRYGFEKEAALRVLEEWSVWLGPWAIPAYVAAHTLTLSLCLPYAVFFEAGASFIFGFFPAVLCVFSAKILGASLSFSVGRLVFRSSTSAMEWAQSNKYFHLLSRGVEKDGWRFVLLARFSPIPSYVINYALAATNMGFALDFLLPTVVGCLPMILQNISIGSLAGAAVATASGSNKSKVWSFLFPLLGIVSSVLISFRIKSYAKGMMDDSSSNPTKQTDDNTVSADTTISNRKKSKSVKKGR